LNNDYINLNKELENEEYKTRFKDCIINKPNYVVTFNGEHYDLVVLSYIKDILSELEDVFNSKLNSNYEIKSDNDKLNILSKIKQFSSNVIEDESFPVWKYKNRFKDNFIHIDLFLY
jgi:hypothetical protein